jgi:drug/metabolite transporter (DMT)-like permease
MYILINKKPEMKLTNQQKGSSLAFIAVFLITPDSLFIRLSNIDTWGLLFYRGAIPFVTVLLGMLFIYRMTFFKLLFSVGYPGVVYIATFAVTNITFIISIQNTNVANTLVMIAMAPMISAVLGALLLKENPDKKTWITIFVTFLAALYIFYDSIQLGNFFGDIFGFITATGLAIGAVVVRSAKDRNLVPSAVIGKLVVAIFAVFFVENFELVETDIFIVPLMCVMCVAIPFVLVTIAPRFITAAEVNLFFLLETILGPIWVWLIIKEQPSLETIQGGLVIITAITIHSYLSLKKT